MKAVVLERPCSAAELAVQEVPLPQVKPGWVLVKIKGFGLNRSELFTRQGDSPSVKLPRIIGIECVGEVADPSDSSFHKGQRVVSLMGGLGREFDGSYAEYALIPASQVYPVDTEMDWTKLAAIPETYYTAYASLVEVLRLEKGEILLIRGGTSSVGRAALQLAKSVGATVVATTRHKDKLDLLRQWGADFALLDDGKMQTPLFNLFPAGANKILELVGTVTLKDSLKMLAPKGILCMTGILGGEWVLDHFEPMMDIPSGAYFTQFSSEKINKELLRDLIRHIEQYALEVPVVAVFSLEDISKAHFLMENNSANGKIVVMNP